jgi:predicted O-methyltransferase YrrM
LYFGYAGRVNAVLEEIFTTRRISRPDGSTVPYEYSISADEGAALQQIIRDVKPRVTLEIGLAHGVSALFICEALKEVGGERHIVIDPGPVDGWNDVGLHTIERGGYASLIEFHNAPSHQVLPQLEQKGERIGVALIDGWHTFDYVLVDFFYIDRILDVGGVVMFDDTRWYPGIRKVARYVATHRRYRPLPNPPTSFRPSVGRRLFEAAASLLATAPLKPLSKLIVRPDILEPDAALGLPPDNHIAFRKMENDVLGDGSRGTRAWNQHVDF